MAFVLTSATFGDGDYMPSDFTCDGRNVSPELAWDGVPVGTRSLALTLHDPDAPNGDFTHWLLYDVAPVLAGLSEGQRGSEIGAEGTNDFGYQAYGGPCPPHDGGPHHYRFVLSALDTESLDLPAGATRRQVEDATRGHVIARAELTALYRRVASRAT